MIPKVFHYCWLSNEPFPEKVQKCMASWEKFLGDYNCIFWDYEKAVATGIPWILEALEQQNWAFAADAVRLYALYTYGGIYLDSDVELLKSPNFLLDRAYILGYENGSKRIEPSFLGAEKESPIIGEALRYYAEHHYEYSEETVEQLVLPQILANACDKFDGLDILPEWYFSPKRFLDGAINTADETVSIHHFGSNWRPENVRECINQRQKIFQKYPRPVAEVLAIPYTVWSDLKTVGPSGAIKRLFKK